MLFQLFHFLLEVLVTLVGGACLLRLTMRWRRLPMGQPLGQLVQALSDWLVLPLQRLLPPGDKLDAASLLAVWLLKLVQHAALLAALGLPRWGALPVLALLGVAKLAVSVATALIVVAAVLSWMQQRTPLSETLNRLCEPLLAPVRRHLPLVGGVDLSPLVVIVALQALAIVLGSLQGSLSGTGLLAGAV